MIYTQRSTTKLPYTFDFSSWSLLDSSPITSASAAVSPSGPTLGTPSINAAGDQVTVTFTGGTSGTKYRLTITWTTGDTYTDKAFIDILVSDPSASP